MPADLGGKSGKSSGKSGSYDGKGGKSTKSEGKSTRRKLKSSGKDDSGKSTGKGDSGKSTGKGDSGKGTAEVDIDEIDLDTVERVACTGDSGPILMRFGLEDRWTLIPFEPNVLDFTSDILDNPMVSQDAFPECPVDACS